ncbi:MFS general substrate transporter [Atractiella rhizophila]|nr:MFS general substrate transporter [Atractiella rhizophila]KAH8919904.1 MFS general substrate transporter [Atractiella rhizophila]KAH8922203.1 MFS general substrate transporter [Atractiella rhizophila]
MTDSNPDRVLAYFSLAPQIKRVHVFSYILSSFFSVSYLVFLNASLPLLLTQVLGYPSDKAGDVVGSLTLLHELIALPLALLWGHLSDVRSPRFVSSIGHLLIAISLPLFVLQPNPYFARIVFAAGGSALVTMIPAVLSGMGKVEKVKVGEEASETAPLLESEGEVEGNTRRFSPKREGGKLAGWVGVGTGSGALVAVFFFLRLPPILSERFSITLSHGLIYTYFFVAILALGMAFVVSQTLRFPALKAQNPPSLSEKVLSLFRSFSLATSSPPLRLAYVTSFASRAQTIVITLFIPLLITTFYLRSSLCPPSTDPSIPKSCPQAYHHIASLNGVIELLTLLLSPLIPSLPLGVTLPFICGSISFTGIALLPSSDPRHPMVWVYAVLLGFAQIGGIVGSLVLLSKARSELLSKQGAQAEEVAGGIGGGSTVFGGLGILIIGRLGGWLFDELPGAPFALMAGLDGIVAVLSFIFWIRQRRSK